MRTLLFWCVFTNVLFVGFVFFVEFASDIETTRYACNATYSPFIVLFAVCDWIIMGALLFLFVKVE